MSSELLSYYHVIVKGNNARYIFLENNDKKYYLKLIFSMAKKENFKVYAWCVMDNHIHLIIKANPQKFSTIFRRVNIRYSKYYHNKYNTCDHLFRRLKHIIIKDDEQLLCNIKYVHNNPVKANIVENFEDYEWSSYKFYLKEKIHPYLEEALGIFGEDLESFIDFHKKI